MNSPASTFRSLAAPCRAAPGAVMLSFLAVVRRCCLVFYRECARLDGWQRERDALSGATGLERAEAPYRGVSLPGDCHRSQIRERARPVVPADRRAHLVTRHGFVLSLALRCSAGQAHRRGRRRC
jgi:hypothetical protein